MAIRRQVLGALSGAILALTLFQAAPAMAAGTNGSAVPSSSSVTPFTVVNVGGGTWNYGSDWSFFTKHVWSHYVHNSLYHSATAIIGSQNLKVLAYATYWANADVSGSTFDSTAVYWATY
jgi:hypothetical protein